MFETDIFDNIKHEYQKYIQSHTIAKNILVISINLSILTDDCITNLAKRILDIYIVQYKGKNFIFCFILFIYLVTTKVFLFKSITIFNANFLIIINKFSSLAKNLSADL